MTVSRTLRELAGVIDDLEAAGLAIKHIDLPEGALRSPEEATASLTVSASLFEDLDRDGLRLVPTEASVAEDGTVTVDLSVGIEVDEEPDRGDEPANEDAATEPEQESPAYHDPERLRTVYEAHDSFPAMTEALGVDVSPQTVRRHMINHGIHEPESRESSEAEEATVEQARTDDDAGKADEESAVEPTETNDDGDETGGTETTETALADGIDLPANVGLEELKEIVRTSQTVYEIQQHLEIDRQRTRRILEELDLIDLVSRRLDTGDREVTLEEIDERIRHASPTGV